MLLVFHFLLSAISVFGFHSHDESIGASGISTLLLKEWRTKKPQDTPLEMSFNFGKEEQVVFHRIIHSLTS